MLITFVVLCIFGNEEIIPQTTDTNVCQKKSKLGPDNTPNVQRALPLAITY